MRYLLAFIQKEIWHILRDRQSTLILLIMPIVQLLLFGYAISTEVKDTQLAVMNVRQSHAAAKLVQKIDASDYINIIGELTSRAEIEQLFRRGEAKGVLVFPDQFDNLISHNSTTQLQLVIDASDPNETTTVINYLNSILIVEGENRLKLSPIASEQSASNALLVPMVQMLYNPQLESSYQFVPGVMGLIFLLVCTLMTSVSIVRERDFGTMEVLLVSPFKPLYIVVSKVVPYFLLSMINLMTILVLAYFVFKIPYRGELLLLVASSIIYILLSLSLGVLISTVAPNQQAAMVISMMGMMLPTLMLSGLIFPVHDMPPLLQWISNIVPARWYISSIRTIMIKGLGLSYVWQELLIMLAMLVGIVFLSIKRFKIRLE